jgi:putative oxidoreductase
MWQQVFCCSYTLAMKRIFQKLLPVANIDIGLLVLRVTAAAFMLVHGTPKLLQVFSDESQTFPGVLGMNAALSLLLAVFAEFVCAVFIIMGLFTRIATIPLIITMAVAAFHIHGADPFTSKEKALLFLLIFIFLLLTGAGRYSIDGILLKRYRKKERRYI